VSGATAARPLWRALAWAYGLLFVLYALTTGAKIYYLTGAYVYLLAAGAVAIDGWLYARARRILTLAVATAAPDYAGYLSRFFTSVHEAAILSNPYGVHNIESGGHVYICTGPREPWSQMWPRLRHYD
jgi:hypothetical protein